MTIAVLAEKPSVARDIARVLGARGRADGVLTGNGYAVTWAVGHLVALAEPHQIKPQWKRWRASELPMIPDGWPLEVVSKTRDRFEIVARLLRDPKVDQIVCATDAGREGELIFRYIYEAVGIAKPVKRLWVSSLTEDAIRDGFANLRDGADYDGLADAAKGRSRADWLVGMNLSRAYTLASNETLSVGRVQTPTLAMIVERDLAIRSFVPEDYREVVATFAAPFAPPSNSGENSEENSEENSGEDSESAYQGIYFRDLSPEERTQAEDAAEAMALARRLPADGEQADQIIARARSGRATIESVEARQRKLPPPLLYDLTELQRHANRLFGYSAKRTLDLAQSLYESKKLLSYPRTGSRHLSTSVTQDLPAIVSSIRHFYLRGQSQEQVGLQSQPSALVLAAGTGERPLGRRYVDDSRVTDHHAIIPTPKSAERVTLTRDEARIYDLVCRRLLAAWHEDHLSSTTTLITAVRNPGEDGDSIDRYRSIGTTVDREGWKVLEIKINDRNQGNDSTPQLPSGLSSDTVVRVVDVRSAERRTRPPRRFTDSTLLTGMETAGRTLDDKQLSDAMRATGLGTPATRAAIIETLIQRDYVVREKKTLAATDKGIALIDVVHPDVRSPRMTGEWEARLQEIHAGRGSLPAFMKEIERYVKDVVQRVVGKADSSAALSPALSHVPGPQPQLPAPAPAYGIALESTSAPEAMSTQSASPHEPEVMPAEPSWVSDPIPDSWQRIELDGVPTKQGDTQQLPLQAALPIGTAQRASTAPPAQSDQPGQPRRRATPPEELEGLLHERFGFSEFRPHQRAVCASIVEGRDALLVMPTGAGKSLCYQLPGIARAGTTLVVSPLIALMEDQVSKLQAQGFAAERIHSGRKRAESRQVSGNYLAGRLDFLFIAPERLGVTGFPELLARRKPTLVAIDEAHCISQWGHDFRPDYRMLGDRLPGLRPAPILALTATATPLVQRDIVKQLGLDEGELHIHGFRRENIFIELVELRPGARNDATTELLSKPEHRPAIVYAPTRKKAEELARQLKSHMPAAVYHAGIPAAQRDRVQTQFLSGEIEVIVATVAFGMGIDKADVRSVVHTALPASIEGYYQEIGRAGRDGQPSRAVLYHSYADRRTHEWFLDRDYPDVSVLRTVHRALGQTPVPRAALDQDLRMDPETTEKVLEKLWIHGGALVDSDDRVSRGGDEWEAPYREQREHKQAQLDEVSRFSEGRSCHMLQLVRHFGDQADSGRPCGNCASCQPDRAVALDERPAAASEQTAMCQILDSLRERDGQSKGRLHRVLFGEGLDRKRFEILLGSLVRALFVHEQSDSFEKDGETIHFHRLHLTEDGRRARAADVATLQVPKEQARSSKRAASPRSRSGSAGNTGKKGRSRPIAALEAAEAPKALVEALKSWRLRESKRRRCPAFRILNDRTLIGIAREIPRNEEGLLAVRGMGPTLVRKYGKEILAITCER